MRKEKKIKTIEKGKKNIYLISAAVIMFLVIILLLNANKAFKNMENRECVKTMVLFGEGMLKMEEEFRVEVPDNITPVDLARDMIYYFHYGQDVFENPENGPLKLKDPDSLKGRNLVNRTARYLEDIPKCPAGGQYTLIPSETHPGLFDIECSIHGRIYLPEFEDKYLYDGDIDALGPRMTNLGKEADIYFAKSQSTNEFIILIPYTDREQRKEEAEKSDTAEEQSEETTE